MYIGRFLIAAPRVGAYRVSSRSYPNRKIKENDSGLDVVPTEDYDNPYISYGCLRTVEEKAVIGNGVHVSTIAEKIDLGYPPRDSLALCLLTLDFERDEKNTPRIAAVISEESYAGIVSDTSLLVKKVTTPTLVSTYGDGFKKVDFDISSANQAAKFIYDMDYESPVASCAVYNGETAIYNG